MIEYLLLLSGALYLGCFIFFYAGIRRIVRQPPFVNSWQPRVSVLVSARNEAARITGVLETLSRQIYPVDRLEVLIIDDHSTDDTAERVRDFIRRHQLAHFHLIPHRRTTQAPTYKKTALKYGLRFAKGEIIMTTDADCRVQPGWAASMVQKYTEDTGVVAGLVTFDPAAEKNGFHKLQTAEFAGVVFSGVGAIGNHFPIMCNASNFSYRRKAFDEIGGFEGHEHIPSGDDDLFIQHLHHRSPWRIRYNLDPAAVNHTRPLDSLSELMNQRSRWASKVNAYPDIRTRWVLAVIYLFYPGLLLGVLLSLGGWISWKIPAAQFLGKIFGEWLVFHLALSILNRRELMRWFGIGQLLQIPYIIWTGFNGCLNNYHWKQKND